ncbi:MAG: hypothetical protein KGS09_15835 [Nitrospirae bacterium]|nr:hypothetical protein [Nitrospirota bacterium]MDE3042875.1 hypothetical protein [Nitrospirota bacterium]MDE3217859.1 hypothetical protein [Nitrospirota bacterium]
MNAMRFAFCLFSCVLVAGQLPFPSGQAYAAQKKPAKSKPAAAKSATSTRQCCMPGAVCPTPLTDGSPGCKCCGFRVDGTLVDYKGEGKDSTLDIDGLPVTFVVKDKTVDTKLKDMGNGAHGQFILKQKEFESTPSPTGHGIRLECIDVGNTSVEAHNKEFLLGTGVSDTVYEVIEALLNAVPKYPPELPEDK